MGCATISASPRRVAMRFSLFERLDVPLCSLTVRPLAGFAPGYDSLAILGYLAPSRLRCIIDSIGTVTITPAAGGCLDYWTMFDSLAFVVDGMKGCFGAEFYTREGIFATDWICFDCETSGAPPVGVDPPAGVASNYIGLRSENPWRSGSALIVFGLAKTERVELKVYDLTGHPVKTLADRTLEGGQEHLVVWDGDTDGGGRVPPGVYFYRVRTPSFIGAKKLLVLKR